RDPVVVAQLPEVLGPQPIERRAIELRRSADRVVDPWLEGLALGVVPGLGGDISIVDKDRRGAQVLVLAGQPSAAFEDQDPFAACREMARQGASPRAAADDDDVES